MVTEDWKTAGSCSPSARIGKESWLGVQSYPREENALGTDRFPKVQLHYPQQHNLCLLLSGPKPRQFLCKLRMSLFKTKQHNPCTENTGSAAAANEENPCYRDVCLNKCSHGYSLIAEWLSSTVSSAFMLITSSATTFCLALPTEQN